MKFEDYIKIKTKDGKLIPLKLTPMQKKLMELIKENKFKLPPLLKWRVR